MNLFEKNKPNKVPLQNTLGLGKTPSTGYDTSAILRKEQCFCSFFAFQSHRYGFGTLSFPAPMAKVFGFLRRIYGEEKDGRREVSMLRHDDAPFVPKITGTLGDKKWRKYQSAYWYRRIDENCMTEERCNPFPFAKPWAEETLTSSGDIKGGGTWHGWGRPHP